jgi:hypothetical protein
MSFFERHIDRELGPLGGGLLPPRRFRRVIRHSRNCHRCAALYERSIRVLRQLENRSPLVPAQIELDAISAFNAPLVMSATAPARRAWSLAFIAVAVASAVAVVAWRVQAPDDDFGVRGGAVAQRVALRVFCAGNGRALSELTAGKQCAVGQSLAFAVGAASTHSEAVVLVTGSATNEAQVALTVTAGPGAEEPVALTAPLEREGSVEVIAAFAADSATAAAAARGVRVTGAVVLRRTVEVVR